MASEASASQSRGRIAHPLVRWARRRPRRATVAGFGALTIGVLLIAGQPAMSPAILAIAIAAGLLLLSPALPKPPSLLPDEIPDWQDAMPCYLSVQNRELRIIESNQLFDRDFGHREGEFCYQVYKYNDAPCPQCPVLLTFEDGQPHTSEETVITRDGSVANVVVTSAPLHNADGDISAVIEMSTNVTEIKSLRRELKQSRQDYKHLFESVPCYICVLDANLEIMEANELYLRDFDVNAGTHCYEVCKRAKERCTDCLVERTLEDGRVHSSEETLTTQHGRRLDLVVHSMPIRDGDGRITAVMEVFTDITEVKRLQKQLTLMGRAVAGMAHRIKNILMGLEGGIYVVNTGMESNDQALLTEGWEMVEVNVRKVSRLVKDLLYCSKERKPKFKTDVCPHQIAREVRDLFASRIADDGIELSLELGEKPRCGRFDPEGLHSLLSNLVANAIDACRFDPTEGKQAHRIVVRCRQEENGDIVFEVEDNGGGIPEEISAKVFEDFFSTKGTEGTGIGLLVVQKVAEEHGGSVTFESQPGQGTRFQITIPAPSATDAPTEGSPV
jgi:PAS domain S-box-containing protein